MMRSHEKEVTKEGNQSILLLVVSPVIWALHFLACYLTAAIWCAKYAGMDRSLGFVREAIGVYTVIAILGIGVTGVVGYRRKYFQHPTGSDHRDTPADRHRLLGYSTLLLSGLSAVATLFVALAAYFIEKCH